MWGVEAEAMALWEVRQRMNPYGEVPTVDQFKTLRARLAHQLSTKMDGSMRSDPETGLKQVVEILLSWHHTDA